MPAHVSRGTAQSTLAYCIPMHSIYGILRSALHVWHIVGSWVHGVLCKCTIPAPPSLIRSWGMPWKRPTQNIHGVSHECMSALLQAYGRGAADLRQRNNSCANVCTQGSVLYAHGRSTSMPKVHFTRKIGVLLMRCAYHLCRPGHFICMSDSLKD
jgi:hypothetical protein